MITSKFINVLVEAIKNLAKQSGLKEGNWSTNWTLPNEISPQSNEVGRR